MPTRRRFLAAGLATVTASADPPQTTPDDVTRRLAAWAVACRREDVPEAARREATRTLLNFVGCAVGGSREPAVDIALRALKPFAGPPQATILGRKERIDVLNAALLNGISSHIFDFDDTHLRTVVHPGAPVLPAILALAEHRAVSGADLLHALIVGVEVECRIANAVYPPHYDVGWHITGTVGPFGAAAAAGKLLGLSAQQMNWALGLAAAQPVGLREMFGTMTKSFHPGRAAQNGLTAAFLASGNYTSSEQSLEAKRGWTNVLSTARNYAEITENLGGRWEIAINTYKPFPCGIVIHPAIDGALQLREAHKIDPAQVERVELGVHPLVLELTGKQTPRLGLEGKFSVYHAVAAALVHGRVGESEFSDRAVQDPATVALRGRITATVDRAMAEDQARVVVTLEDGRRLEKRIEHAIGSEKNPMSDAQLEAKFRAQAEPILPRTRVTRLIELCRGVADLKSAADLPRAAAS